MLIKNEPVTSENVEINFEKIDCEKLFIKDRYI